MTEMPERRLCGFLLAGHAAAFVSTTLAIFGALFAVLVIMFFALVSALLADLRAKTTELCCKFRMAFHEPDCKVASS